LVDKYNLELVDKFRL